jgi:toxin HigB-1
MCNRSCYSIAVIRSFRHKGLEELSKNGRSRRVAAELQSRALRRLDVLQEAVSLRDLHVPGFDFYPLKGRPPRYSLHVNGPWCIMFEWRDGNALRVDLEQYH